MVVRASSRILFIFLFYFFYSVPNTESVEEKKEINVSTRSVISSCTGGLKMIRCFSSIYPSSLRRSLSSPLTLKTTANLLTLRYARTLSNGDDRNGKITQSAVMAAVGGGNNGSVRSRRQGGPSLRSRSQFQRTERAGETKQQQQQQQQPPQNMPPVIKTVQDLEKILPNMPPEEQARIRSLIDEYGDGLNEYLAQAVDLGSAGTLDETGSSAPSNTPLNDYETAIGVLTQMVEYIVEQENEGLTVDNEVYVKLWDTVKMFGKIQPDPKIEPPLQVLVMLFQIAKAQNSARVRRQAIKSVGDILYGYQLVRLDPYNEVDYLSALIKSRNTGKAIKIWESRRSKKDVQNSIWWLEVGACLYQEAHDLAKAESLALELKQSFNYVPPKVAFRFIQHYLGMRKTEKAWEWYQYMISAVREAGAPGEPESIVGDLSPEEAEVLFNKKNVPSRNELVQVLDLFLKNLCSSYSVIIIKNLCEFGIEIPQDTILSTLETVSKNIVRMEEPNMRDMLSIVAKSTAESSTESPTQLMYKQSLLKNVIQSLSEANPDLLKNPRFYHIWISSLANMDQLEAALEVLELMLSRRLSPPPMAFHSVLKSLLQRGRVDFALRVLGYMETNGASGYIVTPPTLAAQDNSAPISSAAPTTPTPTTTQTSSKTKVQIPPPYSMHYALFIQYGARRNRHSFVLSILDRMAQNNVRHDQSTYLALFYYRYRSRDFMGFFQLLNEAINVNRLQFSSEGYRVIWTIVRDYYRSSTTKSASSSSSSSTPFEADLRSLFVRMLQSKDFKPLPEVYEPALRAFISANFIPEAFATILYMTNHNGLELDPLFCFRLTRTAQKVGAGRAAINPQSIASASKQRRFSANEAALERIMSSLTRPTLSGRDSQSQAAAAAAVGNELAKLKITPEILIQALCICMNLDYSDYTNETDDVLKQFLLAQQKSI